MMKKRSNGEWYADVSMDENGVEADPRSGRPKARRFRASTKSLAHSNLLPNFYYPLRSVEGWTILVTGIHQEAEEVDLLNIFGEYGEVKNLHLNLDHRTGFVKGFSLIEYENFDEAQAAISELNGAQLFGQTISVNWAFRTGPFNGNNSRRTPTLSRSRSPRRRY